MRSPKIKKQEVETQQVTDQGTIFEEEQKKEKNQKDLSDKKKKHKDVDYSSLNSMLADLMLTAKGETKYNQVLDENVNLGSKQEYTREAFEMLRDQNRADLQNLKSEFKKISESLSTQLQGVNYSLEYNAKSKSQRSIMEFMYPGHEVGVVTYEQQQEIKKLDRLLKKLKNQETIDNFNKRVEKHRPKNSAGDPFIPSDRSIYEPLRKIAGWDKIEKIDTDSLDGGLFTDLPLDIERSLYRDGGLTAEWILATNAPAAISGIAQFSIQSSQNYDIGNAETRVPLISALETSQDAEDSLTSIEQSIIAADKNNSYVDGILTKSGPLNLKVKNRDYTFDLSEVWQNCFDCFFESSWEKGFGFKFGIDFEFNLNGLLADLKGLLKDLKFALDIPYIIRQNYCSLARLGSLCPVELAFLIASTLALMRASWFSLINFTFGGFLFEIIGFLLNPILNALSASLRFAFSPFDIYFNCVEKSVKTLQDVEEAFADPTYGWKLNEVAQISGVNDLTYNGVPRNIYELANKKGLPTNDGRENNKIDSAPVASGSDRNLALSAAINNYTSKLSIEDAADFQATIRNVSQYVFSGSGLAKEGPVLVDLLTSPFFISSTDILDTVMVIPNEVKKYLDNTQMSVMAGLAAVRDFIRGNATSKLKITAQVLALSNFLGLLMGLLELARKGIEPCIRMPVYDKETGEQIGTTLETPFTPEELGNLIDGGDRVPTISEPSGSGLDNGSTLYNPITERKFNLVNCDKAKSSIISKGESLDFWKSVTLGIGVDNV